MPLDIRLLKDSEYQAANDFYNQTSHINRPAPEKARGYPEFCWEFMNCPNGKAIYSGAWEMEDGKQPVLVGVQCVVILKMIDGNGKQMETAKGEATLIDIKALIRYKKTDILKELLNVLIEECRKKGIEFLWGLNNIPASYKRLGFEVPFKSYHGVLVLKPFKAYTNLASLKPKNTTVDRFKIALFSGLSYIFSLKRTVAFSQKRNYRINFELNENETLFQHAAVPDNLLFLLQDKDYLKWRVVENPYPINYKSYQLFDDKNTLVAQVICSIQKDVSFIEQTLFDKTLNKKAIHFLLKSILRSLKNENICLVRYTGFKQNHLNIREMFFFKRMGFIFTGKGDWFTFKKISDNSPVKPENIYLSRMYKQGVN
jgi:hypothetical protein